MHKQPIYRQLSFFVLVRIVLHTAFSMTVPLLPVFARGLGIDIVQAGKAISISLLANLIVPLFAFITERKGVRYAFLTGLSLFSLGAGLVILYPVYLTFVLAAFLTTLGTFVFLPAQGAYVAEYVPYEKRGSAIAFSELGWGASFILGVPLAGYLIARSGNWLAPYYLLLVAGLAALAIFFLSFKPQHYPPASAAGITTSLKRVAAMPMARLGVLFSAFLMMGANLIGTVYGYWLEDEFGLGVTELGSTSIVLGVAFALGILASALLTDRLGKDKAIIYGLLINCAIGSLIFFIQPGLTGALSWIFLFYVTIEFSVVSGITLLTELIPRYRVAFLAFSTAFSGLGSSLGSYMAPHLYKLGFSFNIGAVILINLITILILTIIIRRQVQTGMPA